MNNKNSIYLFLFTVILFVSSCKTKKVATTSPTDIQLTEELPYQVLNKVLNTFEVDYDYLAADMKMEIDIDGSHYGASGKIRHERNKGIYLNVKKFGFEVGSVLITPDSFVFINRWQKEYIKEPLTYVQSKFGIDPDFGLLEEVLTGNPSFGKINKKTISKAENNNFRMEGDANYKNIDLMVLMGAQDFSPFYSLYENNDNVGLEVHYGEESVKKIKTERKIRTINTEPLVLTYAFKNHNFDKNKLPSISIPDHYSRKR